ncbi:MAG TPA: type III polyketide synthase [Azospirillaceae bacterium]|nr:type III polyketide synthase [Azospirillaceae bacterium]
MTIVYPRLLSLATTVPPHRFRQEDTRDAARQVFAGRMRDFDRLAPVFLNSGIETRHAARPMAWYLQARSWPEKNEAYLEVALDLLSEAARTCLDCAGLSVRDVDAIVTVSSTGIATPSLDALLMDRFGFAPTTQRLPLFGLGCCGGVLGLSRAAEMALARPGKTVLLLVVELCTLAMRAPDTSPVNIVATALFADGAAAAVLRADDEGAGPTLRGWGEHTWPGTRDIMGWRVEEDGLGVIFSQSIPTLVRTRFRPAVESFLERWDLGLEDLAGLICHPGGAKVLEALADALAPCVDGVEEARAVLRDYGNMSAVTVLFVLERRLAAGARGRHLMSALGPGFTAGFLLVDL